jgi:D-alanyl-D-alanine carboxypeptidase/D-alanyl-D-alanine-endopeptidase (penicillin-binding protein 4)
MKRTTTLFRPLLLGALLLTTPLSAHGAQTKRAAAHAASKPLSLESAIRARLARSPLRGASVGVEIVSLTDGHTIFEKNPEVPLIPASTMKVLTSAAALDRLGPDWRYGTAVLAAAPPKDGIIEGDLYVKGACQPDLVVERFPELAAGLAAAGVREVRGDIVADLRYFDGEERPPEWPRGSRPNPYAAPISALAANFSTVRITVAPGERVGSQAVVQVDPPSDAVAVSSQTRTTKSGRSISASRRLEKDADGQIANRIIVSGRTGLGSGPWEEFIPIENPATVAISAVKRALQSGGITVTGTTRIGEAPEGAVTIYTLRSKPLEEIVLDMNKHSNNFIAEMLQRTLGAEVYGPPATRAKGASAVESFLRTCGVDTSTVKLTDGSGLSRTNQVTALALVRVLVRMRGDSRLEAAFLDSLPIGGEDGTLRGRMGGVARGRVRAKTGHVDGVTTLAGYIDDAVEGPLAFAFLVNGASHVRAIAALDELCRILCTTRSAPI